ncbi:hypothetical protein V5O48_008876 [Marasmius crinis-equi]|uniref:Uncharacterized protein n=1 Tax=Marasmius crinis-equi TaxID=585013 RepID=A0ABR3FCQ8_9AGAR
MSSRFVLHSPPPLSVHRESRTLEELQPPDPETPEGVLGITLPAHIRSPTTLQLLPGTITLPEPPVIHLELGLGLPHALSENPPVVQDGTTPTCSRDDANEAEEESLVTLNADVVVEVLLHLLDMEGPHRNTYRVLTLTTEVFYKYVLTIPLQFSSLTIETRILPRFYREVYITHPDSLVLVKKALAPVPLVKEAREEEAREEKSELPRHVRKLHFGMTMIMPFTVFLPIIGGLSQFTTTKALSMKNWTDVTEVVERCRDTVESLAFSGAIATDSLVQPLLTQPFLSITELAAPIQFMYTPNSPFMTRSAYSTMNKLIDATFPNLRTLWVWVCDATDFMNHIDLRMDFRHLAQLERLHILFRFLDSECVSRYLKNTKVLPSVQCISVEIAQPAPSFPLYNIVTDAYFFDPRVVFIHKGPITPPFDRLIKIYARQQWDAVYDLLLIFDEVEDQWEPVLEKVEERRLYAALHGWVFPGESQHIMQVNAGPFLLSLVEQMEAPWPDDDYPNPLPVEAVTFDLYHSWI